MLFVSEAIAQTQEVATNAATAAPSALSNFIPLILIFGIFYFLLIRPQQKKIKEHNALVDALKKGDEIVTSGGVIGKIQKVQDDILHVEIATDVVVKVLRNTVSNRNISEKAKKETPVKESAKEPVKQTKAKK
jgi:preprotein translocase subunit YajC